MTPDEKYAVLEPLFLTALRIMVENNSMAHVFDFGSDKGEMCCVIQIVPKPILDATVIELGLVVTPREN